MNSDIKKIKKQYPSLRVPSDTIIELWKKANNNKSIELTEFIQKLRPINENKISKSDLNSLVRLIVKRIVNEIKNKNEDIEEESGTAALSPSTVTVSLQKKEFPLDEMTTTDGGTTGYLIPGAFSKRGGSEKGIEGSESIGYNLTPSGKKEMQRSADKL